MLSTVLINDLREASCPMVHNVDSDCAVQNICCFGWLPGICSWGFHSLGLNVFYFYTPFHSFTVFHRTSFVCFFEKCLSRFYWCNNAYKLKKTKIRSRSLMLISISTISLPLTVNLKKHNLL